MNVSEYLKKIQIELHQTIFYFFKPEFIGKKTTYQGKLFTRKF